MSTRREFNHGLASLAFGGLALASCSALTLLEDGIARAPDFRTRGNRAGHGFGPLEPDSHEVRLLDLPAGFRYDVISSLGQQLDLGGVVPGAADGMGSFDLGGGRMALVRNHELDAGKFSAGAFPSAERTDIDAYDRLEGRALPGGTTTIVYDYVNHRFQGHYLSLAGTIRNCAGGVTPWGSWLSCEENVSDGRESPDRQHGWVFEVPAASGGLVRPVPLRAMGRFNHEAAAVDPQTMIVYLTEDRRDGLFYRFLPKVPGKLAEGGRLQALALAGDYRGADARNWSKPRIPARVPMPVRWVDLEDVHSPNGDDLRKRGHEDRGATRFANGEGVHFGFGELYFCVTSGGAIKSGQIMRYRPSPHEGKGEALESQAPATLELFLESTDPATFNFGDNLAIAPNGHLVVCEDPYWGGQGTYLPRMVDSSAPCFLRGVAPDGAVYDIARLHRGSELAGACFSPDGKTLFVNVMDPAQTLAIRAGDDAPWGGPGPWGDPLPGWRIYKSGAAA